MYFQKKIVYNSLLLEGLAKNYVKRCCCIPYTNRTFHGAVTHEPRGVLMSRKVQVDPREVGDSNLQCLSSSFIFLLLKKVANLIMNGGSTS